ncbi:MAG: lipid-A-disaccharide synthase [Proteobacteria bacterium]|nr:lipid-A-disaccharide synthase [Pseudomonadota bacterium]
MNRPARGARAIHVMVVAGEPSGDALGAALIGALDAIVPQGLRVSGVGGAAMQAAGLKSLFPMEELSLMGLAEVLPRVLQLRRRLRETELHALSVGPDAIVTIDSPGFNLRLARRLRGQSAPVIHYVAPQVWAWRPRRAEEMAAFVDHVLALLPFEPPLFEAVGLPCTFVGHPVVERAAGAGAAFRARHGIPANAKVVAVLPGSRRSETDRLLALFGETVRRLAFDVERLHVVTPVVAGVADQVARATVSWGVPVVVVRGGDEKADAFAAADAALAASGTVALELAMARVPMVTAYKLHPVTWQVIPRLARASHVNLVNILSEPPVVPELLQGACTPARLQSAVLRLLTDPDARRAQADAAATAIAAITPPGGSPAQAAARAVLTALEAGRTI